MADFWLDWKGDFIVSSKGGLVIATGDDYSRQRLQRRLLTAVFGYVWHREYGAGLPQKVGDPWSPSDIEAICMGQVVLEASVRANPPPVVHVREVIPGMVSIDVQYISAHTGLSVQFNITL